MLNVLTIDVEDWFHILDSTAVPPMDEWPALESRVERNVDRLLELLKGRNARGTFFWLGWVAQRHQELVRACLQAGHEIASHGYAHVLSYRVGREAFREDATRGKAILEDIIGQAVVGFRGAGFSTTDDTQWVFEVLREAGYVYDSSVFPTARGHGGMAGAPLGPHVIETQFGPLAEIPISAVELVGRRFCLFGGGYLRLAPKWLIRWGIKKLHAAGRPLTVYVHPREIDPDHPRLRLSPVRRFKCYVGLESTLPKLEWLCREYEFVTMLELAERVASSRPPPVWDGGWNVPVPRRG